MPKIDSKWLLGLAVCGFAFAGTFASAEPQASHEHSAAHGEPVESNMHEFMEYYFEPAYKELRSEMASEPENNTGWKAIKAHSLVLAEGGNLLLMHKPYKSDDVKSWREHSVAVRKHGGELFAAAKKKDYAAARTAYEAMIGQCNQCHDGFHHGKPKLKP
ncbi:cytochrome c [Thalassoroseus pseudoceratinae]|uniref:cytochrome c n=1 Tax=Thalassoroseus pseudoceratinae TaxID=2713176 RepID=UPI00141FB7C7|nr:cytochrome c [Thalassoroseus pseudoceratinae]